MDTINLLGQRIIHCSHCDKEFLYFGIPNEGEEYFCGPECIETYNKKD
ncbi:MAG: hypothetical protein Q7R76_01475 [Candidatus Woesearchaeota archaeon]|nr:hypothetical protein [Candidatus Woesearchaeota archaeon]